MLKKWNFVARVGWKKNFSPRLANATAALLHPPTPSGSPRGVDPATMKTLSKQRSITEKTQS